MSRAYEYLSYTLRARGYNHPSKGIHHHHHKHYNLNDS